VENLSVRQVEEMVRTNASRPRIQEKSTVQLPEDYLRNKAQLIEHFNTKVDIRRNNKGLGNIVISFESDEEFIRIINLIKS